jgi:hypothetical protein
LEGAAVYSGVFSVNKWIPVLRIKHGNINNVFNAIGHLLVFFESGAAQTMIPPFNNVLVLVSFLSTLILAGWVDNLNGPTGLIAGASRGIIRSIHCK